MKDGKPIKARDFCFPAGTKISLFDGPDRSIETISIGDKVASYATLDLSYFSEGSVALANSPQANLALVPGVVTDLVRKEDQKLIEVNGLRVTPGHQFLQADGTFGAIGEMEVGDWLVLGGGELERIETIEDVPGVHNTYNFTVAEYHTYVAGGYRVHNDSLFYPTSEVGKLADSIVKQISSTVFADDPLKDIFYRISCCCLRQLFR